MTRLKLNLLAAVIVFAGAGTLGAPSAEAAFINGCSELENAKADWIEQCADLGGTSYQCSTGCSSIEYWMNCTCYS